MASPVISTDLPEPDPEKDVATVNPTVTLSPVDVEEVDPELQAQEEQAQEEQAQEEQAQEEEDADAEEKNMRSQKQGVSAGPDKMEDIELTLLDPEPDLSAPQQTVVPELTTKSVAKKSSRVKTKPGGIYSEAVITRRVIVGIENVGRSLKQNLEALVASEVEGKCIVEGFIKPGSIKLLTYSSGVIRNGKIVFDVVFECMTCCPVEGMLINCVAKNITKAGIRAEIDDDVSPIVVFVARDHNHLSDYFSSITENDAIKVRVIGQRFELNDKYVSVIAEIVEEKEQFKTRRTKPKLLIPK